MSMNLFNSVKVKKPKRNRFNLSHSVKTTAQFGKLIPILCQPVLPGDTFKLNSEILCRFAPFQAPVMHKVKVYTHFFFVPNRLLWDNWQEFITGGKDGDSNPPYPTFKVYGQQNVSSFFKNGSLADYLGFPSYDPQIHPGTPTFTVDSLPFKAYQLIYNEYYRDENLTDPVDISTDQDGELSNDAKVFDNMVIRKRSWKKDYFTSALPFAQRGDEVTLPIFGNAELDYNSDPFAKAQTYGPGADYGSVTSGTTPPYGVGADEVPVFESGQFTTQGGERISLGNDTDNGYGVINTSFGVQELKKLINGVDMSNVGASTINEWRRALAAQQFLEAMARGGSRYIEQLYSIFGVRSSDARLQRPEFLGGGSSPVVISDVLQTSETTSGNPLGTPGGTGVSVQATHNFKRFFEEHGWVIGIMSIMPMPAYQQGMPRIFTKFDRLDYYWPQFAHLGEQEIKEGEIFYTGIKTKDDELFGYTPRYAEYKHIPDSVHGDFRGSLNFWHMGRIFSTPPRLNDDFLTNVADAANRPFSVQDTEYDKIWINIHHNLIAKRPMPVYGTPRI